MSDIAECQLQTLPEAGMELNIFDKIGLIVSRLRSALLRRLVEAGIVKRRKSIVMETTGNKTMVEQSVDIPGNSSLKAGDRVKIRSVAEIEKMLENNRRTQGLVFMSAMKKYCGLEARVLKKVNYIFDERAWKMRKVKNVVVLEGVICNGEGVFHGEGCDRCCYFFWKEDWLKKI